MARQVQESAAGVGTHARVRRHVPSDERRRQILSVAAELFARRGFAGTTTRQIADAVGTSETVLFRLFPSKEALYTAILEQRVSAGQIEEWLGNSGNLPTGGTTKRCSWRRSRAFWSSSGATPCSTG